MKATSILMAKGVFRENDSAHFTIIDVFDSRGADPVAMAAGAGCEWPACVLVAHIEASLADGLTHELAVRIIDGNNAVIVEAGCPPITFETDATGRPMRRRVIVDLPPLVLPALGEYSAVLLADGAPIGDYAFYVNPAEPPKNPPFQVQVHPRDSTKPGAQD